MTITIPDEALAGVDVKESDVRLELAVALFQQDRLTLAQAARLADTSRVQFQQVLAARGINVHFSADDWQDDLRTLDRANPGMIVVSNTSPVTEVRPWMEALRNKAGFRVGEEIWQAVLQRAQET